MKRKLLFGVLLLIVAAAGLTVLFQKQIGERLFAQGAASRIDNAGLDLGDGLHLILCGTGSPLPNPDRAGPCNVVVADDQAFVVDIGEGGARNLNLIGFDIASLDGLLLTHFHSDHIDGMGPLALFYWTQGSATAPLPLIGPQGVERVADGFNAAYALDHGYRVAHHGTDIVPETGGGLRAMPFAIGEQPVVVLERGGLRITAFRVDHDPVRPSVGYRFDYKGRSIVISGDAARSPMLDRAAKGADILVHDALQPGLVGAMTSALEADGQANTAKITRDILDYHASPEDAARSAQVAGVGRLVLSHLVPPIPNAFFYPAFIGDAATYFEGEITVGEDGMVFSLMPDTSAIKLGKRL
ncbi:MBL fold metallo-hydrolase [Erythrobacter sp. SDW2]|uniref:MBL fold metallo-hydrolase n=1 Tax=Erythrobacter sp. SDW2 TaxID=2907154 RepID=UPI001F43ED12|nr:MBL fold metallo-hydrolase [Erythrobacter sp. SDW2]UIP06119.1 MBL fold metallo-hydrolase [Erythrobacter sp. SDW2]